MENNKKKIGIVSYGYGWVPCEPGPNRFYYIANAFVKAGWDVDLIGPSFQHFEKKPRNKEKIASEDYPFRVGYIENPPYRKNLDLKRIKSNAVAAKNVESTLDAMCALDGAKKYDLIYCSIPANNVAAAVAEYAKKRNIPLIVDVEDIWPEAMEMVVKNKLLQKMVFPYFMKDAEKVYSMCDAAVGTSEDYTERAIKYNHRDIPLKTVYVGVDLSVFDEGVRKYTGVSAAAEDAGENTENPDVGDSSGFSFMKKNNNSSDEIVRKPENELWISYAGSLGASYDIETLIRAAKKLEEKDYSFPEDEADKHPGEKNVKIKLLGTGPNMESLQGLTKELGLSNVEFLGYTAYPKMAAYLNQSDVVVNSFIKGAPQSIPNKVGDYLASGSAVISTLENPVAKALLDKNDCGLNVVPADAEALFLTMERLINDDELRIRQGKNARKLAETRFDRAVSYKEIVEMAESLTANRK